MGSEHSGPLTDGNGILFRSFHGASIPNQEAVRIAPRIMRISSLRSFVRRQVLSPLFVLYLTALYFLCVIPIRPEIASVANLTDVALSATPLLALAIGQTLVVITGGIDLSLTSLVAFASVVGALAMTVDLTPDHETAAIAGGVARMALVGVGVGLVHGISVACLKMPAFLVTLVSLMFWEGVAELYTRSQPIGGLPDSFIGIAEQRWLGIPLPIILVALVATMAHVGLAHSVWGRRLYAVGQNTATAAVSGVPVLRTLISAYVISGLTAAGATMLYMMRLETGKPDLVDTSVLLDCIAAVVIGGTSLMGGRGTILGTVLGALFLTLVGNSLNLFGSLQIWHVLLVKGGIILLAAALESLRTQLATREGAAA